MRRPILMLLGLCAATATAYTQDLTGTWEGTEEGNYMKLVIVKAGSEYVGYTYDTDPRGGWCRANFSAVFHVSSGELRGAGDGMIAMKGNHVQCTYELTFYPGANGDRLMGTERTKGREKPLFSFLDFDEGPIELRRSTRKVDTTAYMRRYLPPPRAAVTPKPTPAATRPPAATAARSTPKVPAKAAAAKPATPRASTAKAKAPTPRLPKKDSLQATLRKTPTTPLPGPLPRPLAPAALLALRQERSNTIVQEISTAAPEITIRVFDNGVPDGDTVSILHNNEVVYDHKLVTVQSFSFTVRLDAGNPVHEITLIAHNVGSIPPNTASIVVEAGDERYRLTASTDLQRNAVIRVRYKPQ